MTRKQTKKDFVEVSKRKDAVLKDKEILQRVLDTLNLTGNKLSKHLKYKAPASVYHILEGRKNITPEIIERIIKHFPMISYVFLNTGKNSPLLDDSEQQSQKNLFRHLYPNELKAEKTDPLKNLGLEGDISNEQMIRLMLISQNRTNQLLNELIDKVDKLDVNLAGNG